MKPHEKCLQLLSIKFILLLFFLFLFVSFYLHSTLSCLFICYFCFVSLALRIKFRPLLCFIYFMLLISLRNFFTLSSKFRRGLKQQKLEEKDLQLKNYLTVLLFKIQMINIIDFLYGELGLQNNTFCYCLLFWQMFNF